MSKTDDLQYAKDCLWVYGNLGAPPDRLQDLKDVTASRIMLFNWVRTDEGKETFFKMLLPKAQDALIKAKASKDPDSIREKEVKSIGALKEFIRGAVSEALSVRDDKKSQYAQEQSE